MPYEVACPTCNARLSIRDDTGDRELICPRCLGAVPNPTVATSSATLATIPTTTQVTVPPWQAVPPVEHDVRTAKWAGYFIALIVTLVSIIGALFSFRSHWRVAVGSIPLLLFLEVVLTGLLLVPVGRRLSRRGMQTGAMVGCLVLLAPLAFMVIFLTVCAVCVARVSN